MFRMFMLGASVPAVPFCASPLDAAVSCMVWDLAITDVSEHLTDTVLQNRSTKMDEILAISVRGRQEKSRNQGLKTKIDVLSESLNALRLEEQGNLADYQASKARYEERVERKHAMRTAMEQQLVEVTASASPARRASSLLMRRSPQPSWHWRKRKKSWSGRMNRHDLKWQA